MLNVVIVGCGGISGAHFSAWEKISEAKVIGVCDIREEKSKPAAARFGCKAYKNYKRMINALKPDIVDICLPTYLHPEVAVWALNKGCHVLTEKPVSLNRRDVARVYGAAQKNDRRFMVAQCVRFWDEFRYAAECFRDERFGKLLSGHMMRMGNAPRSSWDNWMNDPERSGLVPFDLHIHDLDYMVATFGKPLSVIRDRASFERQDYIHATYRYDGFFIVAEAAWYDCGYQFRSGFRFQFEKAVLEYSGGVLTVYSQDQGIFKPFEQSDEEGGYVPRTNAYFNEIRYFTDCVVNGVNCDKVKPEELETVLGCIKKLS